MTAERAWAYAMQRKQETAGAPYRVRRHVVTRLAKAAKWAGDLEALCLKTADERTCLEATAYCAWMSGNLLLEKEAWRDALDRYSTAHRICQELGKVGRIEDQDLFSRRVEEIEPILRYCRYNLDTGGGEAAAAAEKHLLEMGRDEDSSAGGDLLAAKLESVVAEARKKQASALDNVEWRGKKVAVRSETLRVALVKADELAMRLARAVDGPAAVGPTASGRSRSNGDLKPGQYLKVFSAYDDALATISEEASRLQGKGGGVKMEAHRAELAALRAYAQHHKLRLMLQRNERLVQELQENRKAGGGGGGGGGGGERDPLAEVADIVHVYDALLQSVRNMVTNLGGEGDANDDVAEEEDDLVESVRADEARFRAFRCFFVIEAFLAQQKWAEASALFGHTRTLCQEAADMLDEDDDPRAESLAKLDEMVQGAWHRTAAHALLLKAKQDSALSALVDGIAISGGGGVGAGRAGRSLQERLKEFDAAGAISARGSGGATAVPAEGASKKRKYRIADFPPSLQLVPCKPRLLDLAFDELEFPDLDERAGIEKEVEAEEESTSSATGRAGLRGWVGWALGK
ncbi:unnamed protein product [Hapterophycus canaliculatus]